MLLSRIDRALSGASGRAERPQRARPQAETGPGAIGERYETVQEGLEQLGLLAQQLRNLEPLLGEIRAPLEAEYETRRNEYVELVNLRLGAEQSAGRIEALTGETRRLGQALTTAERRLEEAEARRDEHAGTAQEARLELDRLAAAQSQAGAEIQAFRASYGDARQRIGQLEQDATALRAELATAEARHGEAEASRARAVRDHALAQDENAALKRRLDEIVSETARLSRIEASLESQLTTERARATGEQAEAARAMRAMEAHGETARQEAASLQARLDALTARSERLEALNADLTAELGDLRGGGQAGERRIAELQTRLDRALERVADLEAASAEARQTLSTTEAARLAAVDRAEGLSRASGAHEKALARSEERTARLQSQIRKLETDRDARLVALTDEADALRSELEAARAHGAITAASLDAARRERAAASLEGLARPA
jgi:crescentin